MTKFAAQDQGFMEMAVNSVASPISVKDKEHRWVYLNDAYCKMIGRKCEDLIGKTDYDFFPTKEADLFWDRDDILFRKGVSTESEQKIEDAEGTIHTVLTKKTLYTDPKGEKYIVAFIDDITDRKNAEMKLLARITKLEEQNAELKKPHFFTKE